MKPTKEYNGRSRIRMFNCDCMDFMEDCDTYDLAIVDPPYRDENQPDQWLRANKGDMKKWQPSPNKFFFKALFDSSENQIIWGGNYFTEYLKPNNNWIVWHKLNEGVHFSMCELAWCSIRKNIQLKKLLPSKSKIHPTQKPVQLYKWLLTNYAKEGDTILDTHGGSLSIAIACWELGFDIDVCELDTDYFNDAVKRFESHIAQTQLF